MFDILRSTHEGLSRVRTHLPFPPVDIFDALLVVLVTSAAAEIGSRLKSNTCWECRPQQLEFNRNWKGGRTRHHAGYLMVRVPEHPRARCNNGYVFEHILVIERLLRRHLDPNESVHHRNGIRDDDRPVNLELWIRPQPAGIRATDAVEWAKEILYRYGSLAASRNAQT
jgi:hypothetical protein